MTRWPRLLATVAAAAVPAAVWEQDAPRSSPPPHHAFVEIIPSDRHGPVQLAPAHMVRIARVESYTMIDTTAWVQQRTIEPVDVVAARLAAAGLRLVALTDLGGGRVHLAADRIVLVRDSEARHAAGARAAIVMVGLRFNTDVAVRETVAEVLAAIRRVAQAGSPEAPVGGAGGALR
jgi:hypothetical protein